MADRLPHVHVFFPFFFLTFLCLVVSEVRALAVFGLAGTRKTNRSIRGKFHPFGMLWSLPLSHHNGF
ncbi:hypothetical protein N657DRAFT_448606 [Parathielavia appendiculata]|uniref:Uncharacterized protein n=1 Tax=Parathielavia appendiculata TaxID=2587402 RepID=A0AAN6TYJ8_9PEZI|nr:hypothetical protein N657DRAFT_448606 [Parathielavia appendiculata]